MHRLVALLFVFLTLPALAGPVNVPFNPTQHVYVVPDNFQPAGVGATGLTKMENELRKLHFPLYVVLVAEIPGTGTAEQKMSLAVNGLFNDWTAASMNPSRSSLFLISYEPHKLELLAGKEWETSLGLQKDKLKPYIEKYLTHVRGMSKDVVGGVVEMAEAYDGYIFDQVDPGRIAARHSEKVRDIVIPVVIVLLVVLLGIFLSLRSRYNSMKNLFSSIAKTWEKRLNQVDETYLRFRDEQDNILGLKGSEGKTKQVFDEVTDQLGQIYAMAAAMRERVEKATYMAARATIFNCTPLFEAIKQLKTPFDYDTGVMADDSLFKPKTKTIKVDPNSMEHDLETWYTNKVVPQWNSLKQAANLRFTQVEDTFKRSDLDKLLASAREKGVPEKFFSMHPLFGDTEANKRFFDGLKALRDKDPLAYAEAGATALAQKVAAEVELEIAIAALKLVEEIHVDPLPDLGALNPNDDPRPTLSKLQAEQKGFRAKMATAENATSVRDAANNLLLQFRQVLRKIADISEAVKGTAASVREADGYVRPAEERLAVAEARVSKAKEDKHANVPEGEVAEARGQLANAKKLLGQAKNSMTSRRFYDAMQNVLAAQTAFTAANNAADRAVRACEKLDQNKANYERKLEQLRRQEASYRTNMERYGREPQYNTFQPPTVVVQQSGGMDVMDYLILDSMLDNHARNMRLEEERSEREWLSEQQYDQWSHRDVNSGDNDRNIHGVDRDDDQISRQSDQDTGYSAPDPDPVSVDVDTGSQANDSFTDTSSDTGSQSEW